MSFSQGQPQQAQKAQGQAQKYQQVVPDDFVGSMGSGVGSLPKRVVKPRGFLSKVVHGTGRALKGVGELLIAFALNNLGAFEE